MPSFVEGGRGGNGRPLRAAVRAAARVGVLFLAGLACRAGAQEQGIIRNLRVPLRLYESGVVRMQLRAEEARALAGGDTDARNVWLEFFDEQGKTEATMWAERCLFNREKGVLKSDSPVRLDSPNLQISGHGMEWHSADDLLTVCGGVTTVLQRVMFRFPETPGTKEKEKKRS